MTKHASTPWHRLRHVRAAIGGSALLATVAAAGVVAQHSRPSSSPATAAEAASGTSRTSGTPGTSAPSAPSATAAASSASTSAVADPSSGPSRAEHAEDLAHRAAAERRRLAERAEAKARAKARAAARAEARAKARARARARAESVPDPALFRMASFNVLGDSHTGRGGDKPGYASGATRMGYAVQALRDAGANVVGFQEYESVQHYAFMRRTGGSWGVYPGTRLGSNPVRNSIAWRQDSWTVLEQHTIPIPYFRGTRVPMPYVLLQHDATGRRVWFINVHNPASNARRGNNERWRDLATTLEIQLMNRLRATGTPVVLMGDFNERAEAFCAVTGRSGAIAANGGTSSPCRPPANAGIDWIFGSSGVGFSAYARLRTALVARASDHPLITTTAMLDGPLP